MALKKQNTHHQKKVALIGCGLIGQSWAVTFLSSGWSVSLFDPVEGIVETAKEKIMANLSNLQNHGLVEDCTVLKSLDRIHLSQSLSEAVKECTYIQESGPEDLDIKKEITRKIDNVAPVNIPIASSTSGIPTSAYAANIPGNYRCVVAHPINPPHLIPAVEIVPAPFTKETIKETVKEIILSIGKEPLELKKETPGFVVNRLQGALLKEAFNLIKNNISSAEDIDKAISHGLGLRWSFMGPFQTIHLNAPEGIKGYVERYGTMYSEMFQGSDANWSELVEDGLDAELLKLYSLDEHGKHEEQRNKKLIQLLIHKIRSEKSD